jgi:lipopolysaccharide transport system permease protein
VKDTAPVPRIVIRPARGWPTIDLRELWDYRDLLLILVWRDLKVRYAQTVLGGAWAVLQPFLMMLIFTIFFGRLARIATPVPYPVYVFAALVPWTYFAGALNLSSNSLVHHAGIITKVYFPRLLLPVASLLSGLVDFSLSFLVLLGLMAFYGIVPSAGIFLLPLLVLLAFLTAFSVSIWLAALNVLYRDIRHTIPFLTQVWLFATPIIYPSSMVAERFPSLYPFYMLNPMAGVVDGFRWALLGQGEAPQPMILVSFLSTFLLLVAGLAYFRWMERTFADVV